MRNYLLLFLVARVLTAQPEKPFTFTAGFKAGSAINDPKSQTGFQSTYNQSRWTGGPTVELHLPYRFAIEFDALYWSNRSSYSYTAIYGEGLSPVMVQSSQRTRSWDLPLLFKYRIPAGRKINPFISAGYMWTAQSTEQTMSSVCTGAAASCPASGVISSQLQFAYFERSEIRSGLAAGAGLEFRTRSITITPELRFSRPINTYPHDNRLTGMVGFTFGRR